MGNTLQGMRPGPAASPTSAASPLQARTGAAPQPSAAPKEPTPPVASTSKVTLDDLLEAAPAQAGSPKPSSARPTPEPKARWQVADRGPVAGVQIDAMHPNYHGQGSTIFELTYVTADGMARRFEVALSQDQLEDRSLEAVRSNRELEKTLQSLIELSLRYSQGHPAGWRTEFVINQQRLQHAKLHLPSAQSTFQETVLLARRHDDRVHESSALEPHSVAPGETVRTNLELLDALALRLARIIKGETKVEVAAAADDEAERERRREVVAQDERRHAEAEQTERSSQASTHPSKDKGKGRAVD